jgi:hypothetical protein
MLNPCPECERPVSDRAAACPGCGFPLAEQRAAQAAAAVMLRDRATRAHVGDVDCTRCDARGFVRVPIGDDEEGAFEWCLVCEHSGRVELCRSDRGYFAVDRVHVAAFLAGEHDDGDHHVVFLGADEPAAARYPAPGPRFPGDD